MSNPDAPAISLVDVRKQYGSVEAVRGVSIEIRDGEFLALIGPSGCGKTSTLRMIAGLETPTSGDILFYGRPVTHDKPWQRDTPLVWQGFALFPHLTVARNVEFGLRMHKVPKGERQQRVADALRTVGLEEYANRLPAQLSGGQKQRVGIARALVLNPRVLLLDEPLGALDARIGRAMQAELRRLHQELGITFVYVTHNQSEALAMADRIAIMNAGELQQVGAPREVFRRPQTRFVAEFVGANNLFAGQVRETREQSALIATPEGDFRVPQRRERPLQVGEAATFVVGADRLLPGDSGDNRVAGRVSGIEYVGAAATLFLTLPTGHELRLQLSESDLERLGIAVGAHLPASWATADAYVLPEAE
ncbi:MAG: ABC transporter ATP-binding protein [Thermomicrobiales bacterium]